MSRALVLASTSPYRRALLERLGLPFLTLSPDVDESRHPDEPPDVLVRRLAEAKARAVSSTLRNALVIGSDQVAVLDDRVLGKPGSREGALEQLQHSAGKRVDFLTGLCLLDSDTSQSQVDLVPYSVRFRPLSRSQIEAYVDREQPLNAAGSFKSEGLGIALFERMEGPDPTALVGLPLIRLVDMLESVGYDVLLQTE